MNPQPDNLLTLIRDSSPTVVTGLVIWGFPASHILVALNLLFILLVLSHKLWAMWQEGKAFWCPRLVAWKEKRESRRKENHGSRN